MGVTNPGLRIRELLQNIVVDVDGVDPGMAVTGLTRVYGEWQYGLEDPDSGLVTWYSLGQPAEDASLLLGPHAFLRFIPDSMNCPPGPVEGIAFRAWDRTSGEQGQMVAQVGEYPTGTAALEEPPLGLSNTAWMLIGLAGVTALGVGIALAVEDDDDDFIFISP